MKPKMSSEMTHKGIPISRMYDGLITAQEVAQIWSISYSKARILRIRHKWTYPDARVYGVVIVYSVRAVANIYGWDKWYKWILGAKDYFTDLSEQAKAMEWTYQNGLLFL